MKYGSPWIRPTSPASCRPSSRMDCKARRSATKFSSVSARNPARFSSGSRTTARRSRRIFAPTFFPGQGRRRPGRKPHTCRSSSAGSRWRIATEKSATNPAGMAATPFGSCCRRRRRRNENARPDRQRCVDARAHCPMPRRAGVARPRSRGWTGRARSHPETQTRRRGLRSSHAETQRLSGLPLDSGAALASADSRHLNDGQPFRERPRNSIRGRRGRLSHQAHRAAGPDPLDGGLPRQRRSGGRRTGGGDHHRRANPGPVLGRPRFDSRRRVRTLRSTAETPRASRFASAIRSSSWTPAPAFGSWGNRS